MEYNLDSKVIHLEPFDSTKEYSMRNLIFLSYAVSEALKLGAEKIYYAAHFPPDYDKGYYYQDCSPEFVEWMNQFLYNYGLQLETPYLHKTLQEEIQDGIKLGVDFSNIQICNYEEGNCGLCSKCMEVLRELQYANAPTFPHFNQTIYSITDAYINNVVVSNAKEKLLEWLPLHELRLYTNNRCQK
ncbi:MAG: hypothetical protein COX42_00525, partial [Parcubacteria group bacterium CG23_combo_of_CG06-09_8_20_14_all_35_6]